MVQDQYGMAGLVACMRVAETEPQLVTLPLGFDLTTFNLDLKQRDSLYTTFGGPWGDAPVRAEDTDFPVPRVYNISDQVRNGHELISSVR